MSPFLRLWVSLLVGLPLLVVVASCNRSGSDASTNETEVFMWTGANNFLPDDSLLFQTQLAFAERQGIVPYESGIHSPDDLRRFLNAARQAGIEQTWIEIGPDDGMTAEEFATDSTARQSTLERFRALARTYERHGPEAAHITIFDEAPLGAFTPPDTAGYSERAEAFREYGPEGFALMYEALKAEMPSVDVGIFLHHPHNASEAMAGTHSFIDDFMADAQALGATPDFIYSDVYRGYFNPSCGV